jgi:predicted DNA-binding antitoxin AbrB/MazE fold protein
LSSAEKENCPWVRCGIVAQGEEVCTVTIRAKYENGVFRPLEEVNFKEGTVVEVLVPEEQPAARTRPSIKDLPFYGIWKDRADIGTGIE